MGTQKNLNVVSLFSGIGGIEKGIVSSTLNCNICFSSEIDKFAQSSYLANFKDHNLHGDITKIDEKDIPDHDFLVGGFPCQAFSIAGKREGFEDTRGTLFYDVARILEKKQPSFVFLENVKNLISHDGGNTILTILNMLNTLGYTVDFTVINSIVSGVPQSRDRTYIVGILNGATEPFKKDKYSLKVDKLKEKLNQEGYTAFNFFHSLSFEAEPSFLCNVIQSQVNSKYYLTTDSVKEYLEHLETQPIVEKQSKILKILDIPREVWNDLERQRRVYSTSGVSPTVLARSDTTKILLEEGGLYKIRKVTPWENFRIQGFPEAFIERIMATGVSDGQAYKQSGNAVSPPVITEIMNHFATFMEEYQ
ncbi:MAG: DNA (cytosine-5-)-methyltransferase [Eubacteriales bacterium]